MPFMHGRAAVNRTLQYLQQGKITLHKNIRILMFSFNHDDTGLKYPHHKGLHNFVNWHLPQLQYKNSDVQMITLVKLTPTPWIKAYFADDSELLIDCDSRSREEIHDHVMKILGKPEYMIQEEAFLESSQVKNPAYFGPNYDRECICEVPGHTPCPGWFPFTPEMTGKGRKMLKEKENEMTQQN